MRFATAILSVVIAAASASAAAVAIERQLSTIYKCSCPIDKTGVVGVDLIEDGTYHTYTCAYPLGSCEWDQVTGFLINDKQPNCLGPVPCLPVTLP